MRSAASRSNWERRWDELAGRATGPGVVSRLSSAIGTDAGWPTPVGFLPRTTASMWCFQTTCWSIWRSPSRYLTVAANLARYASGVGIVAAPPSGAVTHLAETGYVRVQQAAVAFLVVAPIGPDYSPGRVHCHRWSGSRHSTDRVGDVAPGVWRCSRNAPHLHHFRDVKSSRLAW